MPIRYLKHLTHIPCRIKVLWGVHPRFHGLYPGIRQVAYALLTRAPVAIKVLLPHDAPRLACVRPVASVHPEPGSNSSLYLFILIFLYLRSVTWPNWLPSLFFYCTTLASSISSMNFSLQRRPHGLPVLRKCCKDTAFYTYIPNIFQCFFELFFK